MYYALTLNSVALIPGNFYLNNFMLAFVELPGTLIGELGAHTYTHAQTHTHSLTHTHTPTHTLSHTHAHTLTPPPHAFQYFLNSNTME